MKQINDGGSAYPKQPIMHMPHGVQMVTEQSGMSLRDYFAASALTGLMSNPLIKCSGKIDEGTVQDLFNTADAMVAERENRRRT